MTETKLTGYDLLLRILNEKVDSSFLDNGVYENASIIAATNGLDFKTHYLRFLPLWCAMYILHTQGFKFDPTLKDLEPFKKEILTLMRNADYLADKIYGLFKEENADKDIDILKLLKQKPAEA